MSALTEKDVNAQLEAKMSQSDGKAQEQLLKNKLGGTKSSDGTYVSPSDAIMSPASQKLASFKQKQINKQNNPIRRSLFSRTLSTNSERSLDFTDENKK